MPEMSMKDELRVNRVPLFYEASRGTQFSSKAIYTEAAVDDEEINEKSEINVVLCISRLIRQSETILDDEISFE